MLHRRADHSSLSRVSSRRAVRRACRASVHWFSSQLTQPKPQRQHEQPHRAPPPPPACLTQRRLHSVSARPATSGHQETPTAQRGQRPAREQEDAVGELEDEEWEEGQEWEEGEEVEDEEWEEGVEYEEDEEGDEDEGEAARNDPVIPPDAEVTEYQEGLFVEVGTIIKAFGIQGEVKVMPITDQPDKRFRRGKRLWLLPPAGLGPRRDGAPAAGQRAAGPSAPTEPPQLRRVLVERARIAQLRGRRGSPATASGAVRDTWAVKLREVGSREAAEGLARHTLLLAVCDREPLRDGDEYYVQDLIGLQVVSEASGELLGAVVEVYDGTGTYDTLRVRLLPSDQDIAASRYRTVLLPFAPDIVPDVDLLQRRLVVRPPEGLLDLCKVTKLRTPYTPEQQAALLAQVKQLRARGSAQQQGSGTSS